MTLMEHPTSTVLDLDDLEVELLTADDGVARPGLEGINGHAMTELGASSIGPGIVMCSCCCCNSCG